MFRKILLILLIIAIIGAGVYSYFSFRQIKQPVSEAVNAIPMNAALVIEGNDFPETWKKLSNGNIMWEALKDSEYFRTLNGDLSFLDSVYNKNPELQRSVKGTSIYAAAVLSGVQAYHFLFLMSMPPQVDAEYVHQLFAQNQAVLREKKLRWKRPLRPPMCKVVGPFLTPFTKVC